MIARAVEWAHWRAKASENLPKPRIVFLLFFNFIQLKALNWSDQQRLVDATPALRMSVPAGSIVVMDSRLQHRGSANTEGPPPGRARPVLYHTWMSSTGRRPRGSTYSIRKQYTARDDEGGLTEPRTPLKGHVFRLEEVLDSSYRARADLLDKEHADWAAQEP